MTDSIILLPYIPIPLPQIDTDFSLQTILFVFALSIVALLGWILERHMARKYKRKILAQNILLPVTAIVVLILRFGIELDAVKGFILFLLLLFAANSDICTREVDDCISMMIAITALIGIQLSSLPLMLLSAVVITLPQLAVAIIKPGTWGGADIKMMAACSFLLGLNKGLFAIIAGLSLAVSCTVIINKVQKKDIKKSFALIPYLAIGSFIAYLL
jgi:leader peptidase (prepilin peptidase)/N-methyltransferase